MTSLDPAAPTAEDESVGATGAGMLLEVQGLEVTFPTTRGPLKAVDGVSYSIAAGQTLGVVGESGCGKSVAALAILGLLPPPGAVTAGQVLFAGADLVRLDRGALRRLRGDRLAMIFQDPLSALNPVVPIGDQVGETLVIHRQVAPSLARKEAAALLRRVGISDPDRRITEYPHQLSGGMRQRAVIAMAVACRPALLFADEPTTALDVTVQAQILDLLDELRADTGMAMQFISHNLAVVSRLADEVVVMYAGRIVERAPTNELFRHPAHPYTQALIDTVPVKGRRPLGSPPTKLASIPGQVADMRTAGPGCRFAARCPQAAYDCRAAEPPLREAGKNHWVACFRAAT